MRTANDAARRAESDLSRVRPPVGAKLLVLGPLFAVAFSRWGSYIGLTSANIFLPDMLVATGAVLFTLRSFRSQCAPRMFLPSDTTSGWILFFCLTYVGLRVSQASHPGVLILRDIAPFGYLALLPLMARALLLLGLATSMRWLRIACWLHLSWALPAALGLLAPTRILPGAVAGQPFFQLRDDIDASILVLTILIATLGLGTRLPAKGWNVILFIASLVALASQSSRTGIIGLFFAAGAAMLISRPWRKDAVHFAARAISVLLAVWLFLAAVLMLPAYLPNAGVLARIGLGSGYESTQLADGAAGTANARWLAWKLLVDYTNSVPTRVLLGAGPGSDVVAESGALAHLSGDPSVRAPHSWPVGLYARFGLVGVSLWVSAVFFLVRRRYDIDQEFARRQGPARPTQAVWVGLMLSLLVAACLGVVIESPFGALPFSLACAGISACRTLDRARENKAQTAWGTTAHELQQ
jgi:hypothetical protein